MKRTSSQANLREERNGGGLRRPKGCSFFRLIQAAARPSSWSDREQPRGLRKAGAQHDLGPDMSKPRPRAPRAANPSPTSSAASPTPPSLAGEPLLLSKAEVCAAVGRSYQHLWQLMRRGQFPRSRLVGTRPVWLRAEIEEWINNLPRVALKGDDD